MEAIQCEPHCWQYQLATRQFVPGDTALLPVADIGGLGLYAAIHFTQINKDITTVCTSGRILSARYPLLSGTGLTRLLPVRDGAGTIQGVMGILEKDEPQPALYPLLENVLGALPIDLVVFDREQRFCYIGEQTIKDPLVRNSMIGKTEAEYCLFRNMQSEISERRARAFAQCLAEGREVVYEEEIASDDRKLHKARSFKPVFGADGTVQYIIGVGFDITAVRQSETIIQRQHLAIEAATDGIALLDKEGRYYYLNKAHLSLFGYTEPSELLGKSWKIIYGPEEVARIEQHLFPQLMAQGSWLGETTGVTRDGHVVVQQVNLTLLADGDLLCICRDISEARRQAQELQKLALVVEHTSSGVVIANDRLDIEWVNQSFSNITGYEAADVIGKPLGRCLRGSADTATVAFIEQQVASGQAFECELLNYTKGGAPYWVRILGQPLFDDAGRMTKFFAIQENISERKRMEQDLVVAKEAALASARAKRRFLANMSHEIRTPMNAVMGLTSQLLKTGLDERQRFFAETIQTAANNLLTIINDILDLSRIEEGKMQIERIEMNLPQVLRRMHDVLQHKADEKGLAFPLTIDPTLPQGLLGDPHRLNQVLLNVVGNALKFTDKGSVAVNCLVDAIDNGSHWVKIEVTDTGIGMDAETLAQVFEEFSQGDQSFVRRFGGTGLGLPISRSLVQLMGGTLAMRSTPGGGSCVTIRIPFVASTTEHAAAPADAGPDLKALAGRTILLVEDNKFNSLVASLMLRNAGLVVTLAENGAEAIAQLGNASFDLILMDIQMPVMDGVTATRVIREELNCPVPIIALTAHALREEKELYLAAGMNDFLTKPFQEPELMALLFQWIPEKTPDYV